MAFEEYTLLSMRTELKDEFGLGDAQDSIVDRRINKAITTIIRRKNGLWPWQIKDLVIDIPFRGTGTADFTQDSVTATWISGDKPTVRDIISFDTPGDALTSGLLVTTFADPTITLDAAFTPATESGKAFTVVAGYYQLPDNFQRMRSLYDVASPRSRINKRTSIEVDAFRRSQTLALGTENVYSVEKDVLDEANASYSTSLFLLIYPYPAARTTIRGKYVADHQTLSADGDTPLIPRNGRDTIIQVAAWYLAMTYKEASQVGMYKAIADENLGDLLREWDMAVDDSEDDEVPYNAIGPIQGPSGFPSFRV